MAPPARVDTRRPGPTGARLALAEWGTTAGHGGGCCLRGAGHGLRPGLRHPHLLDERRRLAAVDLTPRRAWPDLVRGGAVSQVVDRYLVAVEVPSAVVLAAAVGPGPATCPCPAPLVAPRARGAPRPRGARVAGGARRPGAAAAGRGHDASRLAFALVAVALRYPWSDLRRLVRPLALLLTAVLATMTAVVAGLATWSCSASPADVALLLGAALAPHRPGAVLQRGGRCAGRARPAPPACASCCPPSPGAN